MSVFDNLVCLLETAPDKGLAALTEHSIYSKDFLYGIYNKMVAEGTFDADFFVGVTIENDW